MDEQGLHSPTVAALKITDPRTNQPVNAYTLRRWCTAHAQFLSPGANPGKAAQRRLTDRDVEALRTVAQLRAEGSSTEEINVKLANLSFAVVDNLDTPSVDIAPQTPQDAPHEAQLLPTVLSGINERFEAMERRIEAQREDERSRQQLAISMLVLGIILGVVLVIALQLLANSVG